MAERLLNTEMVVLLYGIGHNFCNMVILDLVLKHSVDDLCVISEIIFVLKRGQLHS